MHVGLYPYVVSLMTGLAYEVVRYVAGIRRQQRRQGTLTHHKFIKKCIDTCAEHAFMMHANTTWFNDRWVQVM